MKRIIFLVQIFILLCLFNYKYAFAFDYVLNKNFIVRPIQSKPAKNVDVLDATFHTTYRRVTDVATESGGSHMVIPVYSRFPHINSDKTKLFFQRERGNPDGMLYNAATHALIEILPETVTKDGVPGQSFNSMEAAELRWDYTGNRPNIMYTIQGMRFMEYDVVNHTLTTIHNFATEFPTGDHIMNDVEGDSSADSRYWAWEVRGQYNGSQFPTIAIITYDKQTNTILGTINLAKYKANGGRYNELPTPNMVEISPLGDKVIYHLGRCWETTSYDNRPLDIDTVFDGPHAWDLNFTNPVKVSIDETHSGWAWGLDGSELFVSQNNRNDWIEARDIKTGSITQILYHGDLGWNNGFHFARMPSFIRGWILMSTCKKGDNTAWGDNQLIILEIKDKSKNPRVWRLGHTHNNPNEYYAEGFAAISQYGDKLWWGAKWPGQDNIEAYEMDLPPNWWIDLTKPYSRKR